jgi:hypothetical protein
VDRRHAEIYVQELKQAGFADDEIGILSPECPAADTDGEAVTGAVTGGIGPILATGLLTGIVGGATTGGILGALVGLGIHEEKARRHAQKVAEGHTLVVVQALGRGGEAIAILRRCEKSLSVVNPSP